MPRLLPLMRNTPEFLRLCALSRAYIAGDTGGPATRFENSCEVYSLTASPDGVRHIIYGVGREHLLENQDHLEAVLGHVLPEDWADWLVITPTRTRALGLPREWRI